MKRYLALLSFLILPIIAEAQSSLELSEIFTDHMVIQREEPIRIWGWTTAENEVSIQFNSQNLTVIADKNGKWIVEFEPMNAGGPYDIMIESNYEQKTLTDVYVGDVWLSSGQSNMEWTVSASGNPEQEIANSNHPLIRHIKVERGWSREPEEKILTNNGWEVSSPEVTGEFTAVGYYFARSLREHVDVPIGLINSSWGGSRIEPWMREEILYPYYPNGVNYYLDSLKTASEIATKKLQKEMGEPPSKAEIQNAMSSSYSDENWISLNLPDVWEVQGYGQLDGIVWLRKEIELSKDEANSELLLSLSKIDDSDSTYVNGELVGSMNMSYNVDRKYIVSSDLLVEGTNVIMIQVEDVGYGGGIFGFADSLYYRGIEGKVSLSGEWKMKPQKVILGDGGSFTPNQLPSILYNKMIAPIIDFPIKGVIWYQGESNAGLTDAFAYRNQFTDMISDWRSLWKQGDFPFLWVQLANFGEVNEDPIDDGWGMLRESQTEALALPNTGQAVIIDIGEADDIHPKNKQDVGLRLALAARKLTYGEDDLIHSGPLYKSMDIKDGKIELSFDYIGSGLMIGRNMNELKEFSISADGRNFVHAKAQIDGGKVIVWSDEINNPMHVRYAWKTNPANANLFNKEGLPASPFRTDY